MSTAPTSRPTCSRSAVSEPSWRVWRRRCLYAHAMHELDIPRRYRTIVVCGGFGLGGHREHDAEGLRRVYEHLEPGGLLVLDNEVPYASSPSHWWKYWLKEARAELPRPSPDEGERRLGSDGVEYELRSRLVDFDALSQRITLEMRASMRRDGELLVEDEHVLVMTLYFTHEVQLMLEQAGFVHVELRAGYTNASPTRDDDFVVLHARKPIAEV